MNWLEQPMMLGRLLLLPLAAIQWAIVLVYTGIIRRFRQDLRVRYASAFLSVCLYSGVVVSQLWLFSRITGILRSTSDDYVFIILFVENLISIGLLLYRLKDRTKDRTGVRDPERGSEKNL
jgi:hypothetical protein